MTNRKFTPPTEFPAEYEDGYGCKVTILGRAYHNKERPLVGFDDDGCACNYAENGAYWTDDEGKYDLHDIPKRMLEQAEARIEELQAKLAKAVEFIEDLTGCEWPYCEDAKRVLAELKGQDDE